MRTTLALDRSLLAILLFTNLAFVDPFGDWQGSRSGFWPAQHPGDWGYKLSFHPGQIVIGAKLFNFHQAADELLEDLLTRSNDVQLVSRISSMHKEQLSQLDMAGQDQEWQQMPKVRHMVGGHHKWQRQRTRPLHLIQTHPQGLAQEDLPRSSSGHTAWATPASTTPTP